MSSHESNKTMAGFPPAETRTQPGKIDSCKRRGGPRRRAMALAVVVCAGFAVWIYSGIRARMEAEKQLAEHVRSSAIPQVAVIHLKVGSAAEEIELPGTTEAFTEAPIYARTSGYLKRWYLDIGSPAKRGQLLAEIETPELDQQLQQAASELKTAQANLQLAQVTASRWLYLLKTSVISKQETDQAVSDLNAKQATANSAEANVRRLQKLQAFERVYAPFDGVITARNTDLGALIQNGDNTGPKELFHLAAIDKLRVYISVPEVYAMAGRSWCPSRLVMTMEAPSKCCRA
jgi:RND family efflux transporter MFP subunit